MTPVDSSPLVSFDPATYQVSIITNDASLSAVDQLTKSYSFYVNNDHHSQLFAAADFVFEKLFTGVATVGRKKVHGTAKVKVQSGK